MTRDLEAVEYVGVEFMGVTLRLPTLRGARRWTALATAGALAVTGAGLLTTFTAPGADAATTAGPVVTIPASRVLTLAGHGWGHGRGMSQNGAYGAAAKYGLNAKQILDFYYPGTASTAQGDPAIRVQLRSLDAADPHRIDVENPGTLVFYDEATKVSWSGARATSTRWRVTPSTKGLLVQHLVASTWKTSKTFAGPVRVDAKDRPSTRVLYPSDRTYTSAYLRVRRLTASTQSTAVHTTMETYLRGVVPAESLSSWPAATLQAQAIAARSYSANRKAAATGSQYDICDTTACQVYTGDKAATARTDAAIKATWGSVRTWKGKPIFAEFSSSDGGWTTAGDAPYLVAKADRYDGAVTSTVHSWVARLPASALERRWPSLGRLRSVQVLSRDGFGAWGGRVLSVRLVGARASATVTGRDVYTAWSWPSNGTGLRSAWWAPHQVGSDVTGDGAADLVVSARGRTISGAGGAGAVAVVPGVSRGVLAGRGRLVSAATAGIKGAAEAGDSWGAATATGDFDGDGRADVAVGAPGEDAGAFADAGMVQVLRGSPSGLSTTGVQSFSLGTTGIAGALSKGARFGSALAAGDVNGDGYDDLLVSAPGAVVGGKVAAGMVTLLPGSAKGLVATRSQQIVQSSGETPETSDRFGSALAVGDVDRDGRQDVVVASTGERTSTNAASGSVRLLRGTAGGLVNANSLWGSVLGNRGSFGRALVLADTDRDGYADLVAAGAGSSGAGAVTVVLGRSNGLTGPRRTLTQSSAGIPDGDEKGDTFGAALAAGDLDGDGYADVVVANPTESVGTQAAAGMATVLYGAAKGIGLGAVQSWRQGTAHLPGTAEAGDGFSSSVAVNDLDGDGFADLAIGAPGEDASRGVVTVLRGSQGRLDGLRSQLVTISAAGATAGGWDLFGGTIAGR